MIEKNLYVISGCNGAGKTTASFTILPEMLNCKEFVNSDEIARGISPFQPETVWIEAGKIMLKRIDELLENNVTFAFETTLSTKCYKAKIIKAKEKGYNIILVYFWLQNVALANERVRIRVLEGGHNTKPDVVERRYYKGIKNLFDIYLPLSDQVLIFDNSGGKHELIAEKLHEKAFGILNVDKFNKLRSYYDYNE